MGNRKSGKKSVGTDVDAELADAFDHLAHRSGYVKGRAFEAALRLFLWVPDDIRAKLMAGDELAVKAWFDRMAHAWSELVFGAYEGEARTGEGKQPSRKRKAGGKE